MSITTRADPRSPEPHGPRKPGKPRFAYPTALLFAAVAAVIGGSARAGTTGEVQSAWPLYSPTPGVPFYYKDDGHQNAYFQRWEPTDFSCRDLGGGTDFLSRLTDPLKCIPLGNDPNSFISVNGAARLRDQLHTHRDLGVDTEKLHGSLLAPNNGNEELDRNLALMGVDVHLTQYFRAYGQLTHGGESGHNDPINPNNGANRNDLTLPALFAEGRLYANDMGLGDTALRDTIFGLRAGRENAAFGEDGFWFTGGGGANVPATTFDGFHVFADDGPNRLDGFAYHVVNQLAQDSSGNTVLTNRDNARQQIWGLYASHDFPQAQANLPLLGAQATKTGIDFFYYGYAVARATYDNEAFYTGKGSTLATVSAVAPSGGSFLSESDYRHEIGLRLDGTIGNFTYDYSGVIQRGSFGSYDVDAYAFHTVTGYELGSVLPWRPWLNFMADYASGGVDSSQHTISTFQPIRVDSEGDGTDSVAFAFSNIYILTPGISLKPDFYIGAFHVHDIDLLLRSHFYFRANRDDAIYNGTTFGLETYGVPGATNNYQLSAFARGDYVGAQPRLNLSWEFAPHLSYSFEAAYTIPGEVLKAIGGKDSIYIRNQLIFNF